MIQCKIHHEEYIPPESINLFLSHLILPDNLYNNENFSNNIQKQRNICLFAGFISMKITIYQLDYTYIHIYIYRYVYVYNSGL